MNSPDRMPPVDKDILQRAMTLAERSARELDPIRSAALLSAATELWAAAHQARRDAMYLRGRQ